MERKIVFQNEKNEIWYINGVKICIPKRRKVYLVYKHSGSYTKKEAVLQQPLYVYLILLFRILT